MTAVALRLGARPRRLPFAFTSRAMHSRSFPAWFVRGGTSNGLVILRSDLPPEPRWPDVLPPAMGSPDPHFGRQLDGIGSGLSSTSKVIVLAPPSSADVDVDYTFVQVGIRDGRLDLAGNCGNMSAMVGPAAWDLALVPAARKSALVTADDDCGHRWAELRCLNTNTSKVVVSRFRIDGDPPSYAPRGDFAMDGVPGTNSPITLRFVDPTGAKTGAALPTGNPVDVLELPSGETVKASLIDVGNPGVFVSTQSLGLDPTEASSLTPSSIDTNAPLKAHLDTVRRVGASLMGLDPDTESVPKIVLLFPPADTPADVDIRCLAMSMGQPHKAMPLTLALCLAASAHIRGTLAAGLMMQRGKTVQRTLTLAHPSGRLPVGTVVNGGRIESAELLRTARVLMKGRVCY
ncbi:hypothetical protein RJ55_01106 [Drechmeria coniospora]|nr:hypothetical protein RJ55_01106 [Drechmeria coniospora]